MPWWVNTTMWHSIWWKLADFLLHHISIYSYTPLDYALMGEHHDVAQYMMEMGGLSITGIQELAAGKIQVISDLRKFVLSTLVP